MYSFYWCHTHFLTIGNFDLLCYPGIQYEANLSKYLLVKVISRVCICIFIAVYFFFMLSVIHVNGHGVVMTSCTPWYRSCNIVK